jgi:membrane fusion protein (multidrug efflux system)
MAPFDGTASERLVSLGQYVAVGMPLTTVIDADPMKAAFDVPEHHLSQLHTGQTIEMVVAAYPDMQFQGKVYFIDPQVRTDTRTVLMKALVPNADGRLRPGMFANLKLVTQVRERALVIPETAILLQGQTTSLFIVKEDGSVESRVVTTGVRLAGMVEIISGLAVGETVIVEGVQKIFPGAKVSVRYEAS